MDSRAFVAWMPDGRIGIVNRELADLVDEPGPSLIGRTIEDMVAQYWADPSTAGPTLTLIRNGGVETVRVHSALRRETRPSVAVTVWARAIDLGDRGWATAAYVVPSNGDGGAAAEGAPLCTALDRLVLGVLDDKARFVAVGGDVAAVLGARRDEAIHSPFTDWVAGDEPLRGPSMIDRARQVALTQMAPRTASMLWASLPGEPVERVVAMELVPTAASRPTDRVAELELRISRIAAEVNAAGLLPATPTAARERVSQMAALTSRQWDILSRLLAGMTSAEIGADLFLSPSTVRNHLSAIFQKFGVHSQVELIRLIGSAG